VCYQGVRVEAGSLFFYHLIQLYRNVVSQVDDSNCKNDDAEVKKQFAKYAHAIVNEAFFEG
jgi:hypothetical protein